MTRKQPVLNFIAPFPREECVQHLVGLRQSPMRFLADQWEVMVEFTEMDKHTTYFKIRKAVAHVKPILTLWGQLYQVDAQNTRVVAFLGGFFNKKSVVGTLTLTILLLTGLTIVSGGDHLAAWWSLGIGFVCLSIWLHWRAYLEQRQLLEDVADLLGKEYGEPLDDTGGGGEVR